MHRSAVQSPFVFTYSTSRFSPDATQYKLSCQCNLMFSLYIYSIIGLYISLVLVVGRLVRGFVSGSSATIMFEELPSVNNIIELCLNVYLARECREFYLEEHLFSKLIFLYRSPQTMIKWTKYKYEKQD